jgi:hypothetical protein
MRSDSKRVIGKSASYTINPNGDRGGSVFTNDGAVGAVDFTLPTPNLNALGLEYRVVGVANFAVGVVGAAAGDILTKNDVAANSVKAQTAGEIVGAELLARCVKVGSGFKWQVVGVAVGHTYTVAT